MILKPQIRLCDYKTMEDELMMDKIIYLKISEKLLLKQNITLQEAIQICKSINETKKQLEIIEERQ